MRNEGRVREEQGQGHSTLWQLSRAGGKLTRIHQGCSQLMEAV